VIDRALLLHVFYFNSVNSVNRVINASVRKYKNINDNSDKGTLNNSHYWDKWQWQCAVHAAVSATCLHVRIRGRSMQHN
jgi:hypothetical protein